MTCESAAEASARMVSEGSASHCFWRARKLLALIWPLIAWYAWAQPATVVVSIIFESACIISVRFFGVASASHSAGGHVMRELCSVLCLLVRRGIKPASVVVGTTVEGSALAFVPSVGVGSNSHCGGGHEI